MRDVLIAGGGIGGLAAALALGRVGATSQLIEQADAFTEVGAGIGLGPNAMRRLHDWGLKDTLEKRGFVPTHLDVRNALDGASLGQMAMGGDFVHRYGAPYMTIHRADLHQTLLEAVQAQNKAALLLNSSLHAVQAMAEGVQIGFEHAGPMQGLALIGADGISSRVRQQVWGPQPLLPSGHWAYRSVLQRDQLPPVWRGDGMGLWLGPRLHVVHYPIRGGELLNLVVIVQAKDIPAAPGWDHVRTAEEATLDLQAAIYACCPSLQELVRMAGHSRKAWALFDKAPARSANDMVKGKVALLGDAAHPMLPYLAQGAGMAIEDADSLAQHWQQQTLTVEQRLTAYAQSRWQRTAKLQLRARRNGRVFHASGPLAWARNLAMGLGGQNVMDQPWLYKY
jgi:salicylate hydroxylase